MTEMNDNSKTGSKATLAYKQLDSMDDFLTVYELAEYLHCNEVTVRRLIKSGEIKAIKLVPGKILITRQSIKNFLEKRRRDAETNGVTDPRYAPYSNSPKREAA